jgi:membrane protease YdiL (CAAX protease family)
MQPDAKRAVNHKPLLWPWWPWCLVAAAAPPVAWLWTAAGHGMAAREPLADLAWLAALALLEEYVFRAGLQEWLLRRPGLARRWMGASRANFLASTAFAAAHLWAHSAVQAAATWPVSLLLGGAYEAGGRRLVWPAALHLWFNLSLYAAGWFARAG